MARKPVKQRAAEQVVRQQTLRDKATAKRRPGRDDIARMLLYMMIAGINDRADKKRALDKLRDEVIDALETQGFDPQEGYDVFDGLIGKYSKGISPFRIKRHLVGPGGGG